MDAEIIDNLDMLTTEQALAALPRPALPLPSLEDVERFAKYWLDQVKAVDASFMIYAAKRGVNYHAYSGADSGFGASPEDSLLDLTNKTGDAARLAKIAKLRAEADKLEAEVLL